MNLKLSLEEETLSLLHQAELAVVQPGQEVSGKNTLDLDRQRDHDAGVGKRLLQLQLEVLVSLSSDDLGVQGNDRLQISLRSAAAPALALAARRGLGRCG